MTTRGDAGQATREGARVTASTVIEGVVSGIITVGAATPFVQTFCIALREAKGIVDEAKRNKEELEELCERCEMITVQVIDKAKASKTSTIDVKPLQECVDKLKEVAERYHNQGRLVRLARFRRDGDGIQTLRARIEAVVPIMGLSAGVTAVDQNNQILALLQPRPELAPVPKKAPVSKSSHVVRDGVVDRVCKILGGDGGPKGTDAPATESTPSPVTDGTPVSPTDTKGTDASATEPTPSPVTGGTPVPTTETEETDAPATEHTPSPGTDGTPVPTTERPVAALTGQSGAGKTTAAAAMVGERGDRVRALFPHGVVWLRVGKGAGAGDRLHRLMHELAKRLYEEVMGRRVDAPELGEDGGSYVNKIVSQEELKCLVVADDVWEAAVVEKLRG
ncbi:unnamed protein product, partial [Ectocarpus sp. 12 AP-2014]